VTEETQTQQTEETQTTEVTTTALESQPSWKDTVPAKFKDDKGEVDMGNLVKSYLSLETKMRANGAPPESPEKYAFKLPEGLEFDEKQLGEFRTKAHEKGLSQPQFEFVMNEMLREVNDSTAAALVELLGDPKATDEALKKEWGDAFSANKSKAQNAYRYLFGDDEEVIKLIGNRPEVIRALAKLGSELGEDRMNANTAPAADRKARLDELTTDPAYFNPMHPKHKAVKEEVYRLRGIDGLMA
jgi:hypothetical protein